MIENREQCASWPDMTGKCCVVCGRYGTNTHHFPPIGTGKRKHWKGALISLCGSGVTGCHGLWHAKKLELRYNADSGCYEWKGENSHGIVVNQWVVCRNDEYWNMLRGIYG